MDSSLAEDTVPGPSRGQRPTNARQVNVRRKNQCRHKGQRYRRGDSNGQDFYSANYTSLSVHPLSGPYSYNSMFPFIGSSTNSPDDGHHISTFSSVPPLVPDVLDGVEPFTDGLFSPLQSTSNAQSANRLSSNGRGNLRGKGLTRTGFKNNSRYRYNNPKLRQDPTQENSNSGSQPLDKQQRQFEYRQKLTSNHGRARSRGGQVLRGGSVWKSSRNIAQRSSGFDNSDFNECDGSLQTLRERLKKQLENNTYECMICCQTIQSNQWIWTCSKCYHMFHMNRTNAFGCITQWALKSRDSDGGWRCPSCQNVSVEMPRKYKCFCGKRVNPPTKRFPAIPHTCDGICGRSRDYGCIHPCTEECHPGPCPPCPAMVTRTCNCGKETKSFRCGTISDFKCNTVCDKILECGVHKCNITCHSGDCGACKETIHQTCYCGSMEREVQCTAENALIKEYSCGSLCTGTYNCGIHSCTLRCHKKKEDGSCGPCPLSPVLKLYCPCGSTKISSISDVPRKSCCDPIPTCNMICNKVLECGPKDRPHRCQQLCHEGDCPPCSDNTIVVCRCKSLKETMPCVEAVKYTESNPFTCERRCRKQKTCKNHRCQAVCCIDSEHICLQICNKKLDCGNHFCERLCHVGQCPKCLQASFEEQYCLCGRTVREPPIPCGMPLPTCDAPCSRTHSCTHSPLHKCHAEPECPPCTVLTEKYCYGRHELRANIPCYLNEVSCGKPCDAPLSCGVHRCKRICHAPPCEPPEGAVCKQPCPVIRVNESCGHPCGLPCHGTSPCPKSDCMAKVPVTCGCSRKKGELKCIDVEKLYRKKMALDMVNEADEKPSGTSKLLKRSISADKYRCLQCDGECRLVMRNKRIAEALSIKTDSEANRVEVNGMNGMASSMYTDYLKSYLKTNFKHIQDIEDALVKLVQTVGSQTERTSMVHAFPPMNTELRRVIHEYASYFNVETRSYDSEPMRNVVATAKRGECTIPVVLLTASADSKMIGSCAASLSSLSIQKPVVPSGTGARSWESGGSGMQQLHATGKVVRRGFSDVARNAK